MFDRPTDDYLFKSNEHLHEEYIFMKERNFCESNGGWVGGGSLLIVRPKEIPSWWYHELWDQLSGIDQQTIIPHQLIRKELWIWRGCTFLNDLIMNFRLCQLLSWNHITKSLFEISSFIRIPPCWTIGVAN